MSGSNRQFRLIQDSFFSRTQDNSTAAGVNSGPTAPAFLEVPSDEPAALFAGEHGTLTLGRLGDPAGPTAGDSLGCVQAVQTSDRPLLLMLVPDGRPGDRRHRGHRLRINGHPAQPVTLLDPGDVVQFNDTLLHVTVYNRPDIGPAGDDLEGVECPYCRIPLGIGTRVYRCSCGAALHCEHDAEPAASGSAPDAHTKSDPLQCIRNVSSCPSCQQAIELEEGYTFVPRD